MSHNATILLAEDDLDDVFFVRRALQKAGLGHLIVHVPDGQQCINYLAGYPPYNDRTKHPLPGVLLLDLKMPVKTGFDVLDWLRFHPEFKKLPVIILSASARADDVHESRERGASDYQVKPIEFDDLVKIMKAVDARWLAPGARPLL